MSQPLRDMNSGPRKVGPSEFAVEAIILSVLLGSGALFTLKYFKKSPTPSAPAATAHNAPAAKPNVPIVPMTPPPVEGFVELESLKLLAKNEAMSLGAQEMAGFPNGRWSGNKHLFFYQTTKNGWGEFELPVPAKGNYQIDLYYTKAPDYGIVQVSIDGTPLKNTIDSYDPTVTNGGPAHLGTFSLSKGSKIRFEAVDTNPDSRGNKYLFGVDGLKLTKK